MSAARQGPDVRIRYAIASPASNEVDREDGSHRRGALLNAAGDCWPASCRAAADVRLNIAPSVPARVQLYSFRASAVRWPATA